MRRTNAQAVNLCIVSDPQQASWLRDGKERSLGTNNSVLLKGTVGFFGRLPLQLIGCVLPCQLLPAVLFVCFVVYRLVFVTGSVGTDLPV